MKERAPTLRQFHARFPSEAVCLDHLMRVRFGDRHDCEKCGKNAHFYRIKERRSYGCEYCGHQVYPTAGTPFERTRTPLMDWFFVMFLFCTSRNGVAAKEVERQLGVTYKTAWRMCHEIRKYMGDVAGSGPIGGFMKRVEIDECFIGGKLAGGQGGKGKMVVMGMVERGGDVVAAPLEKRSTGPMFDIIRRSVKRHSEVHTDEWWGYKTLPHLGYWHKTVNHSLGVYYDAKGTTTNTIEGFWSQLKRGIKGTYIHVSQQHLPKYLAEFQFRWNMRGAHQHLMLDRLMLSFAR